MYYLLAIAFALFVYLAYGDYKEAKETGDVDSIRYQLGAFSLILLGFVICIGTYFLYPIIISFATGFKLGWFKWIFYVLFSFTISFLWFLFFKGLDIFEPEKSKPLFFLFLLSCGSTFLVFPISNYLSSIGFYLDGTFINDFIYCTIKIGLVEEVAKILPFLLILKFSKVINEPYDYLLYAAVSALGFAFIENVLYLNTTNMKALTGRAFFSSVAHIFDSGIIGYCLAIAHYKKTSGLFAFLKGLALAALAHGFYDFWLISEGYKFSAITIGFFLLSIHLLTMMVNNLLNISPYYKTEKRLRTARYKFYLTTCLCLLCLGGFLFILFTSGRQSAFYFAESTILNQSYVLVYLVVSFTSLNVIHGYLMPLTGISRNILLPLIKKYPNYIGVQVWLRPIIKAKLEEQKMMNDVLPNKFTMGKRLVVEGNINWYYLNTDENREEWKNLGVQLIMAPVVFGEHLKSGKTQLCRLAYIQHVRDLEEVELSKERLLNLGTAKLTIARELP